MSFFDFIQNHFLHAFPILLCAAIAVAIISERVRAVFFTYPMKESKAFFDRITEYVLSGRTNDAVALCDQYSYKPLSHVVKAGMIRAHLPESMIEHGLQYSIGEVTQMIQKRTSFLATIANISTLLGLFGTILGLIASFQAVGHADAQQKSALLAAGIATAMNATMMGLAVAIPCMIMYSWISNRANRLVAEIENSAVRVMEILKQRYYSVESLNNLASKTDNGHAKVVSIGRAA
jgi:biopolymer transport protein ExbB